jgi:predicted AlkP superfamily phosphohydrolase/phosphomutase
VRSSPPRGQVLARAFLVAAAAGTIQCGVVPAPTYRPSAVFVLCLDGMDPTLTRRWLAEGVLPNLSALVATGAFVPLASVVPPESPVAWTTFATGVNPGGHGNFGFLGPKNYQARDALPRLLTATFSLGLFVRRPLVAPRPVPPKPFWAYLDDAGVSTSTVGVPMTFPVYETQHGVTIAGFPTPDVRNSLGTYSFWATDDYQPRAGSVSRPLAFQDGVATSMIEGPTLHDPQASAHADSGNTAPVATRLHSPIKFFWNRAMRSVTITLQDETFVLQEGTWSAWQHVSFRVSPFQSIYGTLQFYLVKADDEVRVYASPINVDPKRPWFAISEPEELAAGARDAVGAYRTLGWAESSDKALRDDRLGEEAFLQDAISAMHDREKLILWLLQRRSTVMIAGIDTIDRVSHMLWRLTDDRSPTFDRARAAKSADGIKRVYIEIDRFVGELRKRLPVGGTFMIVSDHGFGAFRREINLNAWLFKNGYLQVDQELSPDTSARSLDRVDWSKSTAYAIGLGQIYLNLRGREPRGIVSEGTQYKGLIDRITKGLLDASDGGYRPVVEVLSKFGTYRGPFSPDAPDLVVGLRPGYRVGWMDSTGDIAPAVFSDNTSLWSGDHCGLARAFSAGVLMVNRPLSQRAPGILDIATTVLSLVGRPVPPAFEGRSLFASPSRRQ